MTHATALAVVFLRGGDVAEARSWAGLNGQPAVTACGWDPIPAADESGTFGCAAVDDMLLGLKVNLPTCPECAVLVDAALESR